MAFFSVKYRGSLWSWSYGIWITTTYAM